MSELDFWRGLWKNGKDSLMRIYKVEEVKVNPKADRHHYRITGIYQTAVGAPNFGDRFPLVGFVTGDQIVFSVSFRRTDAERAAGKPDSMTSWSGQILPDPGDKGEEILETLWHLTRDEKQADEPARGWATIWSGADFFEKIDTDPDAEPGPTT